MQGLEKVQEPPDEGEPPAILSLNLPAAHLPSVSHALPGPQPPPSQTTQNNGDHGHRLQRGFPQTALAPDAVTSSPRHPHPGGRADTLDLY